LELGAWSLELGDGAARGVNAAATTD